MPGPCVAADADHVRGVDHMQVRQKPGILSSPEHLRNCLLQGNDKERIGLHKSHQITPVRSKAHGLDGLARPRPSTAPTSVPAASKT